jgi:hypothetical protein
MIRPPEVNGSPLRTLGNVMPLIWAFAVLVGSLSASDVRRSTGTLGEGTSWSTPWFAIEASKDGPTVLATGGMHGNELAGSAAAEQLLRWPIVRGRLIVVPRANRLGLAADMRWFPPSRNDKARRDLNRNFPTASDESPRTPLAEAIWELVTDERPDSVIDLHEGFDVHVANSKSVGSSVIHSASKKRNRLARMMLEAVSQTVGEAGLSIRDRFQLMRGQCQGRGAVRRSRAGGNPEHDVRAALAEWPLVSSRGPDSAPA